MYRFPSGANSLGDHPWWFGVLAAAGLVTSFTSTLMFTALGSFYNRISDPDMGGAYLTLLNTIANMGARTLSSQKWRIYLMNPPINSTYKELHLGAMPRRCSRDVKQNRSSCHQGFE